MRKYSAVALGSLLAWFASFAHAQSPSATLGRPIPAAALGMPRILGPTQPDEAELYPTAYRPSTARPAMNPRTMESAPMLSPIPSSGPILTESPDPTPGAAPPMPHPSNHAGKPVSSAPLMASPYCESCGPVGGPIYGQPVMGGWADSYAGYGPWWTRTWLSAELLLWWMSNATSPPLVFTAPTPAAGGPPVIGTEVALYDGSSIFPQFRLGGRFGAGLWFDPCRFHGVEGAFFFLGARGYNQTFTAAAGQQLVRRIIETQTGGVPTLAETATTMNVTTLSQMFGSDINYRRMLCCDCGFRLDWLLGFRHLNLHEWLRISEAGTGIIPGFGPATGTGFDEFATTNNFYGGQIGIRGEREFGRFFVNGYGKIAFGVTNHRIAVSGGQAFQPPLPPPSGLPGNLLALNSNIGFHFADSFSVVPEVGLNMGFLLTPRLRVFVGYSFLYWSNVMRPGDQIDQRVQMNRIPYVNLPPVAPPAGSEPHPVVQFRRTDLWAQGINLGLQFKW